MEDLRCTVEKQLHAHVGTGLLDRDWWVRFLQIIGGTEQEAQTLVQGEGAQISVKQFLDFLFGPKDATVLTAQNIDNTTKTDNLREYFEIHYRKGGTFCHSDYKIFGKFDNATWMHKPTGIHVWCDAIDLTSGVGGQVFFHYTSELAFRNITHASKEAAEIWASLRTEGQTANAWWGKGIYTVPLPPDQWETREQLLDNNFRNMMQRDRESEDPEKGPAYVDREYPKRAAFCVPILIDPVNAFDVSIRATPDMEAAGKEPGRNLANKLLNEPGKPPRCCVVLRVSGEDGVQHARAQLLDTLRHRVRLAPANLHAKARLAEALRLRGFYQEALPVAQEMVALCESIYGLESVPGFECREILGYTLVAIGNPQEAEKVVRPLLDSRMKTLGPEHPDTVDSMQNLAVIFSWMNDRAGEAVELYRKVLAFQEKQLGPSDLDTLNTIANLAITLNQMDNHQEAIELHRRALEAREKRLGPEHPVTLQSVSHLANALYDRGDLSEALALQRRALEARDRDLGPEHPSTCRSLERFRSMLLDMINKGAEVPGEVVEHLREVLARRAKTLGPQDPNTTKAKIALGIAFTGTRNYPEAVRLLREALEVREKTLGVDHASTLFTVSILAFALGQLGDFSDTNLHCRALKAREKLGAMSQSHL